GQTGVVYSIRKIKNAATYTWSLPAGASIVAGNNTQTITVNYSMAAVSGNVSVFAANSCGNGETMIFPVSVHPLPVPTISAPVSVCRTSTGNVYSTQAGMTGYLWGMTAGGTITAGSGTNAITVTWNTTGAKSVSVNYTNSNGCHASTPTVYNVTVNPLPVPTISGPVSVCKTSTGNVYSTQTGMTGYLWSVSAGGTITAGLGTNTITVTWNTAGAQNVSVNYTNSNGCRASNSTVLNVTVTALPGNPGNVSGPVQVIQQQTGVSYSVAQITDATGYVWELPSGATLATGENTNTITVNFSVSAVSGNIRVHGTNFCGNGNLSQALFVNVIPTSFTVQNETVENGETRCFNAAQTVIVGGNGTTFIVNPGGSATIIAGVKINFLPQTMVNQGGTMHGYITTNNQYCTAASNPLVMNPASAPDPATTIPEATVNRNIRVYPNPTTAKVTVELTCEMETILEQIDIYSMAGLKLDSHKPEGEKRHELSMEGLKPGVYIVRIQTSKGAEIVKVIKL
ncbi:MAG: T9SS type A sorting domain-containing protein, partial [Bacteroidota bacterium]